MSRCYRFCNKIRVKIYGNETTDEILEHIRNMMDEEEHNQFIVKSESFSCSCTTTLTIEKNRSRNECWNQVACRFLILEKTRCVVNVCQIILIRNGTTRRRLWWKNSRRGDVLYWVRISINKWKVLIFFNTATIHYNEESNYAEMFDESHRKSQSRLVSSFPIFQKKWTEYHFSRHWLHHLTWIDDEVHRTRNLKFV